jgi:type IV secretion system protein TrbG
MSPFIAKSATIATTIIAALSLAGCATRPAGLEAPYDDLGFEQAIPEPEARKPVEVVEMPKLLPLPGQLKPIPGRKRFEDRLPPQEAIAKANQAARMEPTRAGYINAIQRLLRNCDLTLRVALCAPVAFPVGALAAV